MNTNTAQPNDQSSFGYQPPQPPQSSYGDQPPSQPQWGGEPAVAPGQPVEPVQPSEPVQPAVTLLPNEPVHTVATDQSIQSDQPAHSDQPDQPTQPDAPMSSEPTAQAELPPETTKPSEDLADQNIFFMLGVTDGTDEQREAFLDELQQVIWEDFVEHDVELLLTEQENTEFRAIMQKQESNEMQKQEEAVVYLEKLIPDLEEIMLEKALQLKEEMARERFRSLQQLHTADEAKLAQLNEVSGLMDRGQWYSASEKMNALG